MPPSVSVPVPAAAPAEPCFRRLRCLGGAAPLGWFIFTRRVAHWGAMLLLAVALLGLGRRYPDLWLELLPPVEPPPAEALPSASRPAEPPPSATLPSPSRLRPARLSDWLQRWQAYLGVATLGMALLVWLGEVHEDWVESRPKLMTCLFLFQGRPAIVCRHVDLAGPGDLRAWAQQVCAQAVGARFLDFYPAFHVCRPRLGRLDPSRTPGWVARLRQTLTGEDLRQHFVIQFHLRPAASNSSWRRPDACHYLNAAASPAAARPIPTAEAERRLQTLPEWAELRRAAKRHAHLAGTPG